VSLDDPATLSFGDSTLSTLCESLETWWTTRSSTLRRLLQSRFTGGVNGNALIFRVCDRGSGIPFAARDGVFTPFYRSPAKGVRSAVSGLGLSIARRLARRRAAVSPISIATVAARFSS